LDRSFPRCHPAGNFGWIQVHRRVITLSYRWRWWLFRSRVSIVAYGLYLRDLVSPPLYYRSVLCLYSPLFFIVNLGLFIRNWWVRRKRLNQRWAVCQNSGISKGEFGRLLFTVLSVLLIYWPLSLYRFVEFFRLSKLLPYHWQVVHGPLWKLILFQEYPKVTWSGWIGVYLAITSFAFIGFTRNARRAYEHCVELIYDRLLPKQVQAKLPSLRKISEACKEERNTKLALSDARNNVAMMEGYLPLRFFLILGNLDENPTKIGSI
jgi:hypothetical protein